MVNPNQIVDNVVYHIYAKDVCLYNCLNEDQFNQKWKEVKAIVGLMKTDYTLDDLSYEKLPAGIGGGGGTVNWKEPEGSDSY